MRVGRIIYLYSFVLNLMMLKNVALRNPDDDFNSIPSCLYWAIQTLGTIGYGISPQLSSIFFLMCRLITMKAQATLCQSLGRDEFCQWLHSCWVCWYYLLSNDFSWMSLLASITWTCHSDSCSVVISVDCDANRGGQQNVCCPLQH